ncbi:MAG: BamA/TamA family outer membrane protein [Bacteroidetes bacterium]|nr:BamA/TamA family outer membrane protein [Bacteroidota bacterium]
MLLLLIAASSCNSQKKVARRGGYLLVKNSIKTDNASIPSEEIEGFFQQKATSRRFTIIKPGVWIYETLSKGKQTKIKNKIKEKYGTAPVILDTNLALRTEHNIILYLHNKGFYHPIVTHSFKYKRAIVTANYRIIAGKPHTISSIQYDIPNRELAGYVFSDTSNRMIMKGVNFDTYLLDDERDRITQFLRNNGYYSFSRSNIAFRADTSSIRLETPIVVVIRDPSVKSAASTDSVNSTAFSRYFIHNIYVMPDLEQSLIRDGSYDTLAFYYRLQPHDSLEQVYYFIHGKKQRLKPIAIASAITIRTGQAYDQEMVTQTYKRIIGLSIVRSANIGLTIPDPRDIADKTRQWLDCSIKLTRNPVNLLTLGTEGTNSSGSLGMGFNALYQNRNLFKRAETFRLKINTGAELQANAPQIGDTKKLWIFNALEAGVEAGIDLPRLLLPNAFISTVKNNQARTSLVVAYGFESRPDYSRKITTTSWTYQWNASQKLKYIFTPLELSFVRMAKDSAFEAYLVGLTDPQFIGQYNDHLLTMIRYSVVYSNMAMLKEHRFFFFRANIETSGNVFNVLDKVFPGENASGGYYKRFGVRYAQYLRTDIDFRKFWNLNSKRSLAFHLMTGVGLPYGNSDAIPFEKSFWLGGANDMRGWRIRSLGPGGYTNDSVRYDRTGDLLLCSSFEYRFPIYSFLHGSLFSDVGNIWLRQANPDFPNGDFILKNLGKQLAMDAGFGLRFDFSFFIFRLDWAFRMKNPQHKDQWFQSNDFRLKDAVWNFGIGFPF